MIGSCMPFFVPMQSIKLDIDDIGCSNWEKSFFLRSAMRLEITPLSACRIPSVPIEWTS